MKRILKTEQPSRLREWKSNNEHIDEVHYDVLGFPKEEVKGALLDEQGSICAYTMLRITPETSHIEHLVPRSVSRGSDPPRNEETVDYQNLVACHPKLGVPGQHGCPYGADRRGNWWDPENFVRPIDEDCESRFRFLPNGSVEPMVAGDVPAHETIQNLGLDHPELKDLRTYAYDEQGILFASENALTEAEARSLAEDMTQRTDQDFSEFCTAIAQVALDYADRLRDASLGNIPDESAGG